MIEALAAQELIHPPPLTISVGLQQRFQHNNPKQRRNQHPKNSVRNADETTKRHIRLSSCRQDKHNSNGTHSHVWHVDTVFGRTKESQEDTTKAGLLYGPRVSSFGHGLWVGMVGRRPDLIFFDGSAA